MTGIIVLDKSPGVTSARAVSMVKRLLPRGTKIGHAGTLDPFATGVLVLLIGRATRQCETIMGQPKVYETTVKLGATTASDDPESPEELVQGAQPVDRGVIELSLAAFRGAIEQTPPAYSAIKLGGKRACDRVRAGEDVQLKPRTVQVHRLEVLEYEWPLLRMEVECGRGTYIRSLARDIGQALGVGGYLTQLRRTRIGLYRVEDAITLQALTAENLSQHLLAPQ